NVEVGAVCDVYQKRREAAAAKTGADAYLHYTELLARKDLDGVVIATPEHWHQRLAIDALNAGKHVYLEKPMTQTISQAREVVRKVRSSGLKLQVGVQGMSDETYEVANEYVRQGTLGKVVMAQIDYSGNYAEEFWYHEIDPDIRPGVNLDWEAWLGPAPRRPWDPLRFTLWRHYWDYSGGIATDFFIHRITRILKSLGLGCPERVTATGGKWHYTESPAEVPDTFNMLCDYPGGPTVALISSMANDTKIKHVLRGHKATLEFTADGFVITPQEPRILGKRPEEERKAKDVHLLVYKKKGAEDITLHHRNLLNAVRQGEALRCDVELGYYGAVVTLMGVQSFREQAYLKWNREKETVEPA
ncbi:MAG: Gfo/Idh/MocA family oxidoreductase, partial [Acidobacteriota bacterium]